MVTRGATREVIGIQMSTGGRVGSAFLSAADSLRFSLSPKKFVCGQCGQVISKGEHAKRFQDTLYHSTCLACARCNRGVGPKKNSCVIFSQLLSVYALLPRLFIFRFGGSLSLSFSISVQRIETSEFLLLGDSPLCVACSPTVRRVREPNHKGPRQRIRPQLSHGVA